MVNLQGVKQGLAWEYDYSDNDVKMITVPIGQCEGDFNLPPEQLNKYFGIELDCIGSLPEYLITPHLNSTLNESRSSSTGRSWWDITGEVVVYQPVEWVPIVRDLGTIPVSDFEREYETKTTTVETSQVYGTNETLFTLSSGISWKSIKLEVSDTTTIGMSHSITKEMHDEIVEKGKNGAVVIKKVALGICLRVKRVFEHRVKLYLNDEKKSDSLTWDGPGTLDSRNDIWVPASALRDVTPLQFHPIKMSGTGHSDSLCLQALPVFNPNGTLTDMHLIFSCAGWTDWYAYLHGTKDANNGREETIALPDNKPPLVTFIQIEKTMDFPGVMQGPAGEYYYSDNAVRMITVPIGECQGDFNLPPEQLKKYFDIDLDTLGSLPEYMITPYLNSTTDKSRTTISHRWWDITGEVVVYQPVEWVPIVRDLGTIPASDFESELETNTATVKTTNIYGLVESLFTLGSGGSLEGIRLDVSNTTSNGVSYSVSKEMHEEIVEKRKDGEFVIRKLVLGMALKVNRVFEHGIQVYLNDEQKNYSLTWDGIDSWDDIFVASSALRDVSPLQFHPSSISGNYNNSSLWLQFLPVFNTNRTLTDIHVVLSCTGWINWYAYLNGSKVVKSGRVEIIGLPDNKPPLFTLIPNPYGWTEVGKPVNLPGVKQGSAGEYYYSDNDVKMITVPIGQCQGDFSLDQEELKKYFGVDPDQMGSLPEYLITPHLDSTLDKYRSSWHHDSYWDITGEVVVYQPLEWVPIVRDLGTIPASDFESELETKTTTIETSKIYGTNETSFTLGSGISWKAIKLDVSNTTTVGVSYSVSEEVHEEIVEKGKDGEVLIKKLALGMGLKVKRVFEHGVKLYYSCTDKEKGFYFLDWDGEDNKNTMVASSALVDVSPLQFHPIKMSGTGVSDKLWLQVLPVFDTNQTLTDMHVVLSFAGWKDWNAYFHGSKVANSGRVETIALPDNKPPVVTFVLLI